jgi:hypothetical protein
MVRQEIIFCMFLKFLFIYLIIVLAGGYIVSFTKLLTMYQIYLNLPPSTIFLYSPSLIPRTVSTGIILGKKLFYVNLESIGSIFFSFKQCMFC